MSAGESDYYMMATLRDKENSLAEFNSKIEKFKTVLFNNTLTFDKIEIEGCVLDTNEDLDTNWLLG